MKGRADVWTSAPRTPTRSVAQLAVPRQSKTAFRRLTVVIGCVLGTLVAPAGALGADDLVVLDGDPVTDIRNLAKVALTIRAGQVIYQKP